jgi:hypothetical protein
MHDEFVRIKARIMNLLHALRLHRSACVDHTFTHFN